MLQFYRRLSLLLSNAVVYLQQVEFIIIMYQQGYKGRRIDFLSSVLRSY